MKTIKINSYSEIPDNFTGIAEHANGTKAWYKKGKWHREDGPAIEWANGSKSWWVEGKRHRTDGPAIEYADGTKQWWVEDKHHRIDGPACEYSNGTKEWWIEGTEYLPSYFKKLIETSIFLGKEKGKYNLDWLKFLTEQGIEEFPIIPGMDGIR